MLLVPGGKPEFQTSGFHLLDCKKTFFFPEECGCPPAPSWNHPKGERDLTSALPDKLTRCSWVLQLKDKHKQTGGNVGAMEELENAFSLAEESCPGISDKLIAHMVERVQR